MRQKDDKMNFKLHMACGKDELRPATMHVYVTREVCVATDANIMAVVPTQDIFADDESIMNIPEEGMYINSNDWRKFIGANLLFFDGDFVMAHFPRKSAAHVKPVAISDVGPYPNWKAVLPSVDSFDSLSAIGVDPKLLYNLSQALDIPQFKVNFVGRNRPICVSMTEFEFGDNFHQYGVIMPLMISYEEKQKAA
jgi:hypothetical protein